MFRARNVLVAIALACLAGVGSPAWSYDGSLAASYAKLFVTVTGAQAGKELHLMKPEDFVEKIKGGESLVALDIRTPAESSVFSATLPGSLRIPINELFTPENLARIPEDRTVVVLCKSGTRSAAAGIALRHVGFAKVFVLEGGFKALSDYLDAKTANTPPSKVTKSP